MRLSTQLNYAGDSAASAAQLKAMEAVGLDMVWVAEAYSFDAVSVMGYLAATTDTRPDRVRHPADLHPHAHAAGHDRGQPRQPVERAVRPRPRGLRAPGDRGLPRRSLRPSPRPHPRDHRHLPSGVEARARRPRRHQLPHPPAGGAGHRAGQAAQAHQPPAAGRHPDLRGVARPEERRDDRRDRRRLDAALLPARAGRARCGAPTSPPARPSARPTSAPLEVVAGSLLAIGDGAEAVRELARPMVALYVGGMGAKGKNFYNDLVCRYGYEKEAAGDPGPLPRRQEGRGGGHGPRRAAREDHPVRPGGLRRRAPRRLQGERRHACSTSRPSATP